MTSGAVPPPAGFRPLTPTPERSAGFDPLALYVRRSGALLAMGFRIGSQHCNPGGRCHGGVLATFCDLHLAFSILFETPEIATTILPTVNLTLDYLAGASPGTWVQAVGTTVSVTRNLAVAHCVATADGVPVVRASGTYKVGGARVTGIDTAAWLRAAVDGG